jgi:hypothetical protein
VLGADHPRLDSLRAFRDRRLARSAVGRRIIALYEENAAGINAALDRSPALRAATRRLLEAVAAVVGRRAGPD